MHDLLAKGVGDTTRLSSAQREWIRRQGRVARAIEASQRRANGRFSRSAAPPELDEPRSARDGTRKARTRSAFRIAAGDIAAAQGGHWAPGPVVSEQHRIRRRHRD